MNARGLKRFTWFAAASMCACAIACVMTPMALADTAGNTITSGEATTVSDLGIIGNNLYWAGRTLDLKGGNVGGDVIAIGQEIDIDSAVVGGDVRTASQNVFITDTVVSGDITSAGQTVKVGEGATCAGAYLAGSTVTFAGSAKALAVGAQTVTISGTVEGDVQVDAETVTVADGAVITGKLTVHSSNQPQVARGAKVGSLDFHQKDTKEASRAVASPLEGMGGAIYFAIVFAVIAIIMVWAFRRAVDGAGSMVRARPAPMLVTGLVAIVVAIPMIIVLLLVAPLAGSVICAYGMIFFVAAPFAGASIARLIFPRWNRFGAAALGGAVAGALVAVPIVQAIAVFAAFMYLLGYVLQCIYLDMKGAPAGGSALVDHSAAPVPPAGAVSPSASADADTQTLSN